MQEKVLVGKGGHGFDIPIETWKQQLAHASQNISKILGFMTEEHHQVRYFVVRELPRIGKPISPRRIAEALHLSISDTINIIDELEKNLFFLVRNEQGEVTWAFPVTVAQTPHRLSFDTGERLNAA